MGHAHTLFGEGRGQRQVGVAVHNGMLVRAPTLENAARAPTWSPLASAREARSRAISLAERNTKTWKCPSSAGNKQPSAAITEHGACPRCVASSRVPTNRQRQLTVSLPKAHETRAQCSHDGNAGPKCPFVKSTNLRSSPAALVVRGRSQEIYEKVFRRKSARGRGGGGSTRGLGSTNRTRSMCSGG